MKRIQLFLLGLSLVFGIAGTCLSGSYEPVPCPEHRQQLAWWGGLYPEYCIPGAMELKEGGEGAEPGEEPAVKIRFKYLTFFNENE